MELKEIKRDMNEMKGSMKTCTEWYNESKNEKEKVRPGMRGVRKEVRVKESKIDSETENDRGQEGEYVVVGKRSYSGALKSESVKQKRTERKEWKSPGNETVVETQMKEGMGEGKSIKKVVLVIQEKDQKQRDKSKK